MFLHHYIVGDANRFLGPFGFKFSIHVRCIPLGGNHCRTVTQISASDTPQLSGFWARATKNTRYTSKRCTFSKQSDFCEQFCWTKQSEALCLWPTIFLLFFLIFWGFSLDRRVRSSGLWRDEYFLTSVPPVTNPCCTVGRWSRALRALSWRKGHKAPSNTSPVERGASLVTWENQKISKNQTLKVVLVKRWSFSFCSKNHSVLKSSVRTLSKIVF